MSEEEKMKSDEILKNVKALLREEIVSFSSSRDQATTKNEKAYLLGRIRSYENILKRIELCEEI